MKTNLLALILLINFGISYGQNSLELVNNTNCKIEGFLFSWDSNCDADATTTFTLNAGTHMTITAPNGGSFEYARYGHYNNTSAPCYLGHSAPSCNCTPYPGLSLGGTIPACDACDRKDIDTHWYCTGGSTYGSGLLEFHY